MLQSQKMALGEFSLSGLPCKSLPLLFLTVSASTENSSEVMGMLEMTQDVMKQSTLEMLLYYFDNAFISMWMTQAAALTWHKGLMLFLIKVLVSYFLGKQDQFKRQKWEN